MSISIVPMTEEHVPLVRAFNKRLVDGGGEIALQFPESPILDWLPNLGDGGKMFQMPYVAIDEGVVRGGFILKRQEFWRAGKTISACHYRLPLSEGTVNKAYVSMGMQMLRHALRLEPKLFALGMGNSKRPLPRMLKLMNWSLVETPFWFRVNHPMRFLREIRALRSSTARLICAEFAAMFGLGWIGINSIQAARTRSPLRPIAEAVSALGDWTSEVWERYCTEYSFAALRDSKTLNILYPSNSNRFLYYRIGSGWAVLLDTPMRGHKQFGDLRVGTIVDAMGDPREIVSAATAILNDRGVDLVISNQLAECWSAAFSDCGYFSGPSNYIFAVSKDLSSGIDFSSAHINRGDGDGPIHL